ncbi:hypothetical protein HK098_005644 [Nowakowskiella sp. JEL0407]|nr:hypothetical protein HK098_005644 [Nowakowskiella sp. JEL0407]
MASGSMFDKITDLWATRSMASLVKLGIADYMADGPKTAKDIADALNLNERNVFRLLRAISTTNVINRDGDQFSLTEHVGMTLTSSHPMSVACALSSCTDPGYWNTFAYMEEPIRNCGSAPVLAHGSSLWEYFKKHPVEEKAFAKNMHTFSMTMLFPILASHKFEGKKIVDVGGSHGVFVKSILDQQLAVTDSVGIVVDLEDVIATAPAHPRVTFQSGDFFEKVPSGDLYLIKHILHDWDDDACVKILSNVSSSMDKDGKVCVVELLLSEGTKDPFVPFMDVCMMVSMEGGRERTEEDFANLFARSGLKLNKIIPTGAPVFIIEAVKAD